MYKLATVILATIVAQALSQSCSSYDVTKTRQCFATAVRNAVGNKKMPDHDAMMRSVNGCVFRACGNDALNFLKSMDEEDDDDFTPPSPPKNQGSTGNLFSRLLGGNSGGMPGGPGMMKKVKKCVMELMEDRSVIKPAIQRCMRNSFPGWIAPELPEQVKQMMKSGMSGGAGKMLAKKMKHMAVVAEIGFDEQLCPKRDGAKNLEECLSKVISTATGERECKTPLQMAFKMAEMKSDICKAHEDCADLTSRSMSCRRDVENMHQLMCSCGFDAMSESAAQRKLADCMDLPNELSATVMNKMLGGMKDSVCGGPGPCGGLKERMEFQDEVKANIKAKATSSISSGFPLLGGDGGPFAALTRNG